MWTPGDRVRHARWGAGVVAAKLVLGRVRVVFDREPELPRTVRRLELELDGDPAPVARVKRNDATGPEPAAAAEVPPSRSAATRPGSLATASEPSEEQADQSMPAPRRGESALPTGDSPATRTSTTSAPHSAPLDAPDAWQAIEALRLGVVPLRGVRSYTVARNAELASLDALLEEGAGCRVVWGDYGTGKTHLLDAAEQLGLEHGFAVARLTLDPREQALHKPLRLYRAIMASVRTQGQMTPGFEYLLEALKDSPEHYRPDGAHFSRFFSPYLHVLHSNNERLEGWVRDWLRGDNIEAREVNAVLSYLGWRGPRALRMSDYRTYGRMYIHLVGTFACWVADAGARGLLLLFDEVERVDAFGHEDQMRAFEVLKHYAAVTMHPADLAFDPEELYKGGHDVHRGLPLRFRDQQPLLSVFALTPLEEIEGRFSEITSSRGYDIELLPLESALLPELIDRVASLYAQAHPGYESSVETREAITSRVQPEVDSGQASFRGAVRSTVFLLDADRFRRQGRIAR